MIIVERMNNLERRYSDMGVMLLQVETGARYDEAIDVVPCRYTYEETDEPVSGDEAIRSKAEAYDILMGEAE